MIQWCYHYESAARRGKALQEKKLRWKKGCAITSWPWAAEVSTVHSWVWWCSHWCLANFRGSFYSTQRKEDRSTGKTVPNEFQRRLGNERGLFAILRIRM